MKLFVDIEKQEFENRLNEVMPILSKQLNRNHFEKVILNLLTKKKMILILIYKRKMESEKVNLFSLLIKIFNECKSYDSKQ
jgi:hypothetical protein